MVRWSRPAAVPVAPAPGMILPGVPLVPRQRDGQNPSGDGDPLADPDRLRVAREARAAQPLPVRIVASQVPAVSGTPAASPPPAGSTEQDPSNSSAAVATVDSSAAKRPDAEPLDAEPLDADHLDAEAIGSEGVAVESNEVDVADEAMAPAASVQSTWGPWPDPRSPAWPATIPAWGRPPQGFGGLSPRVAMVLKDGSHVEPTADDAQAMLGVVASLGA